MFTQNNDLIKLIVLIDGLNIFLVEYICDVRLNVTFYSSKKNVTYSIQPINFLYKIRKFLVFSIHRPLLNVPFLKIPKMSL